jgi:hypothetical protein
MSINSQQTIYIPDDLFGVLGKEPIAIENAFAVILYNPKLNLEQVRRSIKIILQDVEHRIEVNKTLEKKEAS